MSPITELIGGAKAYGWGSYVIPEPVPNSYESIATINAGGQTAVAFTSIPQTYTHLQIRAIVRSNFNTYPTASVVFRINGSSIRGGIYGFGGLSTDGSQISSYYYVDNQEAYPMAVPTALVASNIFSGNIMDIYDYANTNKKKTYRTLTGYDDNSSNNVLRLTNMFQNETSTIAGIYLSTDYGASFTSGTQFALYGIKGPV